MKFDDIDILIFNAFVDNKFLTSTNIAKIIFNPQDRSEVIAKNSFIDYRLKKWLKQGLIKKTIINKTSNYSLNDEIITFGHSSLSINGTKVDMGTALIIDLKDDGYIVKFLDEEE